MSLYYVQKFIYHMNKDVATQAAFETDCDALLSQYDLAQEEVYAIKEADIGLLYVMGVNGQLLMHYAAYRGFAWDEYIEAMKQGLITHGEVRTGLYASVDGGEGGAV